MDTPRRNFLVLLASALAGAGAADPSGRAMIVRSARPADLEMPLAGSSDYITPIKHFVVRSHAPAPEVRIDDWRLTVEGDVAAPLRLTMEWNPAGYAWNVVPRIGLDVLRETPARSAVAEPSAPSPAG